MDIRDLFIIIAICSIPILILTGIMNMFLRTRWAGMAKRQGFVDASSWLFGLPKLAGSYRGRQLTCSYIRTDAYSYDQTRFTLALNTAPSLSLSLSSWTKKTDKPPSSFGSAASALTIYDEASNPRWSGWCSPPDLAPRLQNRPQLARDLQAFPAPVDINVRYALLTYVLTSVESEEVEYQFHLLSNLADDIEAAAADLLREATS